MSRWSGPRHRAARGGGLDSSEESREHQGISPHDKATLSFHMRWLSSYASCRSWSDILGKGRRGGDFKLSIPRLTMVFSGDPWCCGLWCFAASEGATHAGIYI
jgi:hypothetical protein